MFIKATLTAVYAIIFIDCVAKHTSYGPVYNTTVLIERSVLNSRAQAITNTEMTARSSKEVCHVTVLLDGVSVNCSSRGLVAIPKLPQPSTFIRLDGNKLTNISTAPFLGMTFLKTLNLSCNPLRYISPDIFKGLDNLNTLFMAKSDLYEQVGLDFKYLFSDLKQLHTLCLTFYAFFCGNLSFQNVSILKIIPILEIDGLLMNYLSLPETEISVARTTHLTLRTNCKMRLENKYFSNFSSLKTLAIYHDGGYHLFVENDSFNTLHQLEELGLNCGNSFCYNNYPGWADHTIIHGEDTFSDFSVPGWVDQFIHNVSTSAATLTRLRTLRLEQIACQYSKNTIDCSFAFSELALSKSLRWISLNNNAFTMMSCSNLLVPYFPKSLTYLDIRDNSLAPIAILTLIELHPSIEYIDARYQNKGELDVDLRHRKSDDQLIHNTLLTVKSQVQNSLREIYFSHSNHPFHYWYTYHDNDVYVNLTRMEYSWLRDFKGYALFIPSNFFERRPVLNFLDVTGSGIDCIKRNAFRNASHLETLHMSSNALGKMGSSLSEELKFISTLRVLHIANNGINVLTKDVFSAMTYLQELDVSSNYLTQFLPSVQHLKHLKLFNISYNNLQLLSSKTQNGLDEIRTFSVVEVDLTGNPILCTCKTLHFLKWMKNTKVILLNKHNYYCSQSDGHRLAMENIDNIIDLLDSSCASITVLAVVISVLGALCIAGVSSGLAYRYRWRLRYLYYMSKLRFAKTTPEYERLFDYDAFISYATEDFQIARKGCIDNLENEGGLRLCIHERDFAPGEAIAFNISVGIHSSKKTVLFISESFLQSEWCMYELNIARMESLYTDRTVLLIVILETSVINKLPVDVLDLIRTVTYLEYPEHNGEDDIMLFWRKLTEFIRK